MEVCHVLPVGSGLKDGAKYVSPGFDKDSLIGPVKDCNPGVEDDEPVQRVFRRYGV